MTAAAGASRPLPAECLVDQNGAREERVAGRRSQLALLCHLSRAPLAPFVCLSSRFELWEWSPSRLLACVVVLCCGE